MKRREFVEKLGIGSALIVSSSALAAPGHAAQDEDNGEHDHRPVSGDRANATVSFGAWPVGTLASPLDRTVTPDAPAAPNIHQLIPYVTTIKEGGSVNFVLAGFHQVVVYGPGTRPDDINALLFDPLPGPPGLGLINDPTNRVYRGLSPVGLPQDRVEVVHFGQPGRYLVICAVTFHFADNMFGWVRVRRRDDED